MSPSQNDSRDDRRTARPSHPSTRANSSASIGSRHLGPTPSTSTFGQKSISGPSMVLYRLANDAEHRGRRNSSFSTLTSSSVLEGGDKYPSFRPSTDSSLQLPGPHSAFSRTTSSTASLVPSKGTGSRGMIPYEYDPIADSQLPPDAEDMLHDPEYSKKDTRHALKTLKAERRGGKRAGVSLSCRGFLNLGMLIILVLILMGLFLVYPVVTNFRDAEWRRIVSQNIHVNATGQVPVLATIREPVDKDTPEDARTRKGFDGQQYTLVYSDEFNQPGRTFYPGDDPYLEAMDFWYGVTNDLEWYDPQQVITRDGALVITLDASTTVQPHITPGSTAPFTASDNHNLAYRSGMLQSWNKFCFTSGYIEVSVILPGNSEQNGYWPGAWTMGNLGRAGYRATTDAMWPYSYDECDVGTFPNQTERGDTGPPAAIPGAIENGWKEYDKRLSVLNGQRLSSCTCPNSDHPGPFGNFDGNTPRYRGRGAPEIDIIEVQHNDVGAGNVASQSAQFAPFTHNYDYDKTGYTIFDESRTHMNGYQGSPLQQAVSGLTKVPDDGFQNAPNRRFVTYGFEYWADPNNRDDGYITWQVDGKESVRLKPSAVGPDKGLGGSQVGQRLIPEEPMYIILNLGISNNWAQIDYSSLTFPAEMQIDYVRVYQRDGQKNIGCNPKDFPTSDYIQKHLDQYTNWDTKLKWEGERPKNSLWDGAC